MTPTDSVEPDLTKWDAWSPEEVAQRLARVEAPWYVAAGWALDLFLGGQRREHEDLEIAVPRSRLDVFTSELDGYELHTISAHQTWVRERGSGKWRLDIFSEPSEGDLWICRRDERIRLPYAEVVERTADGIPYGRPEIILLFKAKRTRPKDEEDFAAVLPRLDSDRRRWLAGALTLAHPGHRWLPLLT
ncbi:MAG TPA: hypothetical protein VFR32_09035 [Gaiellaceae bacterium]|nr:hypothetical protein [Gaiellaceae bacterium]